MYSGPTPAKTVDMKFLTNIRRFAEVGAELGPDLTRCPDVRRNSIHRLPVDCGKYSFS
jgi:hypothetical protein